MFGFNISSGCNYIEENVNLTRSGRMKLKIVRQDDSLSFSKGH